MSNGRVQISKPPPPINVDINDYAMAKIGSGLPKGSLYVDNGHIKIVE